MLPMKLFRSSLPIILFFVAINHVTAQKVFSVDYESQADVKVFVVDYESQADLKVFKVKYESQAGKNDGRWFFVKYESQADVKVFFVDYESQAGWKQSGKMFHFF